jgi:hypothetical protein
MGDAEGVARDAVEEVSLDGFAGAKRSNAPVRRARPSACPVRRTGVDLRVVGDVAGEDQVAAELFGELGDAILEAFVLVGEGELCSFAMAGLGNAVGDGAVGDAGR